MSAKLYFLYETKRREKEAAGVSHAVKRDEIPTED